MSSILKWAAAAVAAYFGAYGTAASLAASASSDGGSGSGGGAPSDYNGLQDQQGVDDAAGASNPAMRYVVTGQSQSDYGRYAGPAFGGLASYIGQRSANSANAALAQQQMDFQERMSSTSYQRGTRDMIKAGLNPMLGYTQGGASSPGGSLAHMENALGPGVSSALQAAQTIAGVKKMSAETENTQANTDFVESNTALNILQRPKLRADTALSVSSARQLDQARENAAAALGGIQADSQVKAGTVDYDIQQRRAESQMATYDLAKGATQNQFQSGFWGRNISPYLHDVGSAISSARQTAGLIGRR